MKSVTLAGISGRRRRSLGAGLLLLAAVFQLQGMPPPRDRLAPSLIWKEIPESHVIVVFPEGYEILGAAVAETAQRQYRILADLWHVRIREKIRILLAPDSDVAGGSNLLFPLPAIRIDLAPPAPDSRLSGGREPWFEKVLAHELTRILLIYKSSGFFRTLRRIFGPIPPTLPMMQYPLWLHEGLAVFSESLICPSGRLNTPDYRQMFRYLTAQGGFRHFLTLKGSPSRWPGPVTKFLYGAELFRFLAARNGRGFLQRLVTHCSRVPLSLSINKRFQNVYHLSLRELWGEFGRAANHAGTDKTTVQPLTHDGWLKRYPVRIDSGRLAWVFNNHRSRPGIRLLDRNTNKTSWLLRRWGISSLAYDARNQRLVFSAPEVFQSFRWISDIYTCSLDGTDCKRWSRGKSLFHPHPFPDGSGLICVSRARERFRLARLDSPLGTPRMLSAEYLGLAHPRVSPNGHRIAVAMKQRETNWGIGVFTASGELEYIIQIPGKRCSVPRWLSNDRVAFVIAGQDRTTAGMASLSSRQVQSFEGPHPPEVHYLTRLDANHLLVVFLNARGQDLARIPLGETDWAAIKARWVLPRTRHEYLSVPPARPYRPWRELIPRFLSPDIRYLENEFQVGAKVSGRDAPGRYGYQARVLYGLRTRRWNSDVKITLGGLFPLITLTWRREHLVLENPLQGDFVRTNGFLSLEAQFPLTVRRRYRWDMIVGFHVNRIQDHSFLHAADETVELNGFSLTLSHHSAQRYYDAFSRTDGGRFRLMTSWDLALGGSSSVQSLALDWRRYLSLGHPNVLALRLALAHSWGDAPRLFYLGGARAPAEAGLVEGGLFSLLRGFHAGNTAGFGGWQFNAETRLQLLKIEQAFPVGPSFERLYLTLFCDAGNMWTQHLRIKPVVTWGAELGLVLHMRGAVNMALGMAVSRNLPSNPVIYFRIGESF